MTRDAAQQFVVFNNYTYTLETIIQAGRKNMRVVNVPIRVNGDLRPSRLVRSIPSYIQRSILTIVRIFVIYQPARFFGTIALGLLGLGAILSLRFLYYYLNGEGTGHVQSVIMSGVLLTMAFQSALVAFLGDVIAANRRLLEEVRYNQRVSLTQNAKVPSTQDREDI
jgi:hypothetical protein